MLTFRQKILFVYIAIGLALIVLLVSFAGRTVKNIAVKAMHDRSVEFIEKIQGAKNDHELYLQLDEKQKLFFFRVSVINNEGALIYDSHIRNPKPTPENPIFAPLHTEVKEAFEDGMGYDDDYSTLLQDRFLYMGTAFDFNGKTYVMRTAFPFRYTSELMRDYEIGFLSSSIAVLLLFSIMTWFVIHHLTRPIEEIINAIQPYQEGVNTEIPEIRLKMSEKSEFGKLASTLNSLSQKIKKQIETLTDERNQKETLLESLVEGVIAVDEKLNITYINDKALDLLEIDKAIIGQPLIETGLMRCYTLLRRSLEKKSISLDEMTLRKKGHRIYLDLVASPIKGEAGAILIMQDKSAQMSMLEMRKDFIANASHELKTPITVIHGFAETLHDNPDLGPKISQEITSKIVSNCERMGRIVHDLLTLSDIEHIPRSQLVKTDLSLIIENCQSRVHERYPEAEIAFDAPADDHYFINADPNLIEIAIGNLIDNAAKYSKEPASITVTLSRKKQFIELNISDQGIGIPEKELQNIFQRFYTVDKAHSRKMGGSGLGLAIVESIIEKHAGTIKVKSEMGKGSTFTIRFPAKST
ncbi:MAG: ATP-binding protein [Waddliaceae bacterium]